jgi:hypothetical protein
MHINLKINIKIEFGTFIIWEMANAGIKSHI